MKRWLAFLLLFSAALAMADVPMRDCKLTAPVSALRLTPAQLKPYQQGSQALLNVQGLIFPAGTNKTIDAAPTDETDTALRAAINYHRSIKTQGAEQIATYWHPTMQPMKLQQLNQPGVMQSTKELYANTDSVELLGMLKLNGREVVFIRHAGKTQAYITVETNGQYYLVSDPGLTPQVSIAIAAFDRGTATMAR